MSSARLRVHIGVNFFGAGNIGDDLMLAGFLRALGRRAERLHLTCCTPYDVESQRTRFPEIEWRPDGEGDRARAIQQADIWLALGGTPFQLSPGPWMRDHLAGQMDLVRGRALPMFYLGSGVENPDVLEDAIFRELAGAAAHIWTRDSASAYLLRKATAAPVTAGADLSHAYLVEAAVDPRAGVDRAEAELGLLLAFEDPEQWRDLDGVLAGLAAERVVWLLQEVRTFRGSENNILNSLSATQRRRLRRAAPDYRACSVDDLLAAWPLCRVVASSRYHGLFINAWRGGRLVAIERSGKIAAAAAELDIPLVDYRELADGLEAARTVRRALLMDRAASAAAMIDDFCRVVGIAGPALRRKPVGHPTPRPSAGERIFLPPPRNVRRIAVVKCDAIGDFVLLSPFLRELRRIWPAAQVVLYLRAAAAELGRLCPYVDRVIVVTAEVEEPVTSPYAFSPPAEDYDLVFVPRAAIDSYHGLQVASRIGGRERWGFAVGNDANSAALTHPVPLPAPQSHARMNLALLWEFTDAPLDDRLELWPRRACVEAWQARLAGRSAKPLCLLGIGAQHAFRTWNAENFAAIIPEIVDTFGMQPVLVGSAEENERAQRIASLFPPGAVFNLTGHSLEDVCAVSRLARLYVGNDTGPKHITAAAGVAIVEVNPFAPDHAAFRDSSAIYFHPHGVPYELLQPEIGTPPDAVMSGAAVNSIPAAEVIAAIGRLLREIGGTGGRVGRRPHASGGETPGELRRLQDRVLELNAERETQRRRVGELEKQLADVNEDREARLKVILDQQGHIRELQNHLGAVNSDREARLAAILDQQQQLSALHAEAAELRSRLAVSDGDREARLKVIFDQQAQLNNLQAQINDLQRQLVAVNNDHQARLAVILDQQGQMGRLHLLADQLRGELLAVNLDREARLEIILDQQERTTELQTRINELQTRLGATNGDREAGLKVILNQQQQMTRLQEHAAALQNGLDAYGKSGWVQWGKALRIVKLKPKGSN